MLPEDKPLFGSAQQQYKSLLLNVFPHGTEPGSTTILYEDDGETEGYLSGQFSQTTIGFFVINNQNVVLQVDPPKGSFAGMLTTRKYTVRIVGVFPPSSVTINGASCNSWTFDGNSLSLTIPVPEVSIQQTLKIAVQFSTPLAVLAPFTVSQ